MGIFTFILRQTGLHVAAVIGLSIPVYFGFLYFVREKLIREIRTTLRPAVVDGPMTEPLVAKVIEEETHRQIEES